VETGDLWARVQAAAQSPPRPWSSRCERATLARSRRSPRGQTLKWQRVARTLGGAR
jgi:hypothetical protein